MNRLSILIADDHPIFRKGLRQVIEAEPGLEVVAEADDGLIALEQIRALAPDVAVLDIHMPNMSGFDLARVVREQGIDVSMIFLTMHKAEDIFNAAMDLGVKGYVLKESAITDLVACIRTVACGQAYISPVLSSFLLNRSERAADPRPVIPGLDSLTPTERRVLMMLAEYKTSKQIAEELFVTSRTVDNHRANISGKLGLHGSHALMKFAVEHKSDIQ
ncbi:MAG TPA: response regulator transcription factor [Blastocatellia bacterium]|nr:response regulator transcription factor [Blastocatellia bacterium]